MGVQSYIRAKPNFRRVKLVWVIVEVGAVIKARVLLLRLFGGIISDKTQNVVLTRITCFYFPYGPNLNILRHD